MASTSAITVPPGFTLHTENTSHILLSSNEAFLNPVQEFNRDVSVACIRVWSEEFDKEKEKKWRQTQEKKARKGISPAKRFKGESGEAIPAFDTSSEHSVAKDLSENTDAPQIKKHEATYRPYNFVLLEALSATGLRAIRYAKEIPLVKYVIANDLSPTASAAIKRNVALNGLTDPTEDRTSSHKHDKLQPAGVKINEGDACALMYNHREDKNRVDVVDLDPYGTAGPFIDAAVQCVNDGGLLCVTCTDLSVLATTNYPEKCFSNYGGIPVKAEYCHDAALRLVLHTISTSASRYGRYIEPMLSLSVDFYVRLFVRVRSSPFEVKKALTKTSAFFICSFCQSSYEQPLGRVVETGYEGSERKNYAFKTQQGPTVTTKCPECESSLHLAGPMWSGALHDPNFVQEVLDHLEANESLYGTATRMKGMLTVAKEELPLPFYFTPAKVASFFHCTTPSLDDVASALLHAGHKVSRSHACPGSLKTTASPCDLHDVFRSWVRLHPVKMENISEGSPARRLLKDPRCEANFTKHPDSVTASGKVKLVRYQENPTKNWGPGRRAVVKSKSNDPKRKHSEITG